MNDTISGEEPHAIGVDLVVRTLAASATESRQNCSGGIGIEECRTYSIMELIRGASGIVGGNMIQKRNVGTSVRFLLVSIILTGGWLVRPYTALAADTPVRSSSFTDADYERHLVKLKERLPHEGFSIVIQKPFVVIGDEPLETVKARAKSTVKWAVDHLKQEYFKDDPKEILDIWLFRDANSYNEYTDKLAKHKPTTPYGFYSSADKALFMNIATGGGTLVHEIVHPFMESNFPGCPSWFNEGLASLYEQSGERSGRIIGQTNWRLRGLQTAIQKGTVPSFETLCHTTTREFYDRDKGTNYSQARYLCYYMQERGLLQKFYRRFRLNLDKDPSGYESLKAILGEDDMDDFKKRWEAEILKLRFD